MKCVINIHAFNRLSRLSIGLVQKLMASNESITPPPRKRRRVETDVNDEGRDWEEEVQSGSAHAALLDSAYVCSLAILRSASLS